MSIAATEPATEQNLTTGAATERDIINAIYAADPDLRAVGLTNAGYHVVGELRQGLELVRQHRGLNGHIHEQVSSDRGFGLRLGEVVDLSEGEATHAIFEMVSIRASRSHPNPESVSWGVMLNGKVSAFRHLTRDEALIAFLAAKHNNGRHDDTLVFAAARVLGVPTPTND